MAKKLPKLNINPYDDLFSSEEQRQVDAGERIVQIPIEELHDFKDHPFQIRMDEDMLKLAESIKENGVLSPLIVRPMSGQNSYEIIAGHRRKTASGLGGLNQVPSVIRELTDEQATILMVDTNIQRENILPSERGFAYKMKLDAMNKQGKRTDLTLSQLGTKLKRADQVLADQVGDTRNQIQRYIRITYLIPELIEYVDGTRDDGKKIAFNPAVELSFLNDEQQYVVLENMEELDATPSLSQAQRMKELNKVNKLNNEVIYAVMIEEKANQKDKLSFKAEDIDKYFPKSYTPRQKSELIVKLLSEWSKKRDKKEPSR